MLNHIIKILIAFVIVALLYVIGCSETYFGSLKTVTCEDFRSTLGHSGTSCGEVSPENPISNRDPGDAPDRNFLEFKYNISLGNIDIIFIVDNSSSMHKEHINLSLQFQNFLDDIRFLNYRIAIITTDISSSPHNPVKGAFYQDGKFISIGGRQYLENPEVGAYVSDRYVSDFIKTLVRPETIACDRTSATSTIDDDYYFQFGVEKRTNTPATNSNCPSHDERGIYALNLAIENSSHRGFFRSGVHLMTVLISDEDERSSIKYIEDRLAAGEDYRLEARDYPEILVENVNRIFGPLKNFSFHSIIIPKGDKYCYKKQALSANKGSGSGRGFYGEEYERLSDAQDKALLEYGNLLRGNVMSICDSNYGSQLGRVAVFADTIRASLPCMNPESINFLIDGRKTRLNYDIDGRTIVLERGQVVLTSQLEISIICEE